MGKAIGIQQLYEPETPSSRSLTASYLSAIGNSSSPLSIGQHTVEVYLNADTTRAKNLAVPDELVLTYFDFD